MCTFSEHTTVSITFTGTLHRTLHTLRKCHRVQPLCSGRVISPSGPKNRHSECEVAIACARAMATNGPTTHGLPESVHSWCSIINSSVAFVALYCASSNFSLRTLMNPSISGLILGFESKAELMLLTSHSLVPLAILCQASNRGSGSRKGLCSLPP